jgi:hypothetical protein
MPLAKTLFNRMRLFIIDCSLYSHHLFLQISSMNAHASSEYSVDRLERQPRVHVAQFRSSVEVTEYLPTNSPILVSEPEQSQITRFETWIRVSHPNGILRTARYSHFSGGNLPRTSEARVHWKPKLSETGSYHRALPSNHVSRQISHDVKQKTRRRLGWKMMIVNTFMGLLFWKLATLFQAPAPRVVRSLPSQQLIFNESSVAMMNLPELKASNASQVVYCIPTSVKWNPSLSSAVSLYVPIVSGKPLEIEAPSAARLSSAVSLYVEAKPHAATVASSQLSAILIASPVSGVICYLERLRVSKQLALSKGLAIRENRGWRKYCMMDCCLRSRQWSIVWETVMLEPRLQRLLANVEFGRRLWRVAWVLVGPDVLRFVEFKFGRRMWRIAWVLVVLVVVLVVVMGLGVLRFVEFKFGRRVWRIAWDAVVAGLGVLRFVEFEFGRRVWRIAWGEGAVNKVRTSVRFGAWFVF